MRVLVVEDDEDLSALVTRALRRDGYAVDTAADGPTALWLAAENPYDAVVLDVMIPPPDGFAVAQQLREAGNWVPILMLTARDAVGDRVRGLDAGADDYLVKPFAVAELSARVRSITRRAPQERPVALAVGDLCLDPATRRVTRAATEITLSPREFALLHELMRNAGRPMSRTHLIEKVWDFAYDGTSNVVDVYIGYLRDKIDRPFDRHSIVTVRGAGYAVVDGE